MTPVYARVRAFGLIIVFISFNVLCQCQVSIAGRFRALAEQTQFEFQDWFSKDGPLKVGFPEKAVKKLPIVDNAKLLIESTISSKCCQKGFQFATKIPLQVNPYDDGLWEKIHVPPQTSNYTNASGGVVKTWKLAVASPNSLSLSLVCDEFHLPNESELYVHAEDNVLLGAFTPAINNKKHGKFATIPVLGKKLLIEYFEPIHSPDDISMPLTCNTWSMDSHLPGFVFKLKHVAHGFQSFYAEPFSQLEVFPGGNFPCPSSFTRAKQPSNMRTIQVGRCHINAPSCPETRALANQAQAVALYIAAQGTKVCTGTMLNNALMVRRQFFLTAAHCLNEQGLDFLFGLVAFNYHSKDCKSQDLPGTISQLYHNSAHGLLLRSKFPLTDMALLEVQEALPDRYNVYLAGWYVGKELPLTPIFCLHHPMGAVKKAAITYAPLERVCWGECPRAYHLKVLRWDYGATEGGSSGSALFNKFGYVVGQLHGGYSSCTERNESDYFGSLSTAYNTGMSPSQRLMDWLNPKRDLSIVKCRGVYLASLKDHRGQINPIQE